MERKILRFQTMEALLDFLTVAGANDYVPDHNSQTVTGLFTDAQLELAQNGYQAYLVEETTALHKK